MSRPPPIGPFSLSRNSFGHLVYVGAAGDTHENVVPVRAFAIAAPAFGIALMSPEGKELQWIECLDTLPENTRAMIVDALAQREFMPEIQRILAVSSFATPSTWQVETDRGATSLILKSEDDIRRLKGSMGQGTLLIADSQGINFLIRDRTKLDAASQRILKRFM